MRILCQGNLAEVLAQCTAWEPVEHLIVYNVAGGSERDIQAIMAEGRRVPGAIPGVRAVVHRPCREKRREIPLQLAGAFLSSGVIDNYRDHPDHVAFADHHFLPVAGDRISTDYLSVRSFAGKETER